MLQQGPLAIPKSKLRYVDVQIGWGGNWISLHDEWRFQVHPDGFGKTQHTMRRKKVSSEFFSGEFTVSETENNSEQTLSVWVLGNSSMEVGENVELLTRCFKQNPFVLRTRTNEILVTQTSSGSADIMIDQSHVYLHNHRALMNFTFSMLPGAIQELIL